MPLIGHGRYQGINLILIPTSGWITGKPEAPPEIYANMMRNLDSAVGKIVKAIDDLHLQNNTIIIFTSDNGGERYSDNGIYKGRKMSLWEGGIREPAFVRWTGTIKENLVTNQVANNHGLDRNHSFCCRR